MAQFEIGGALTEIRPGRTVHLATLDKGAPVSLFFLHGGGGNKQQFRFLWQELQDLPVNLIAWDAPGHGASPKPGQASAYAGTALLADAQSLFARHQAKQNFIIAHSLGTRTALALLLSNPDDVTATILLGPPPPQNLQPGRGGLFGPVLGKLPLPLLSLFKPLLARRFAQLAWAPQADPALIAEEQQAASRNSLFMMQSLFAGTLNLDPAALAGVNTPVRILAGAADGITPPAAASALAAVLPNATLHVLPNCGHQIMLEAPAPVLAEIHIALHEAGDAA